MTDVLDDLAFLLDAAGVIGANLIWLDARPDTPDRLIALTRYSGVEPVRTFAATPATRPRIQVIARDVDQADASALAWAAWRALEPVANTTINGRFYARIEALQDPFRFDRDEADRWLYGFNVQAMKEPE